MNKELDGDEAGLLAYYDFNEVNGTTLIDRSTNSYTGTLTNFTDTTRTKVVRITNTNLDAISFAENSTATVVDIDAINAISFSISGTDADKFNINSATGEITFKSAPDFENPTDSGGNNVYDLNVTANGSQSNDTKAVAVTVTDVVENVAPTFTSTQNDVTLDIGDSFSYAVVANDTDYDPLTFSINNDLSSWLSFSSNPTEEAFAGSGVLPTTNGGVYDSPDGTVATEANLNIMAYGLSAVDAKVYFGDSEEHGIRYVDENGKIQTLIAGDGSYLTLQAAGIVHDADTNTTYFGHYSQHKVYKSVNGGPKEEIASGLYSFIMGMALDKANNKLYVSARNAIYEINLVDNSKRKIIGSGNFHGSYADTGVASTSEVNQPNGLTFDAQGRLVFADRNNDIIRRIDIANDTVETIAGIQGTSAVGGNGGQATSATFADPTGVAIDSKGRIFVTERLARVVRMIDTDGTIDEFASVRAVGFLNSLTINEDGELFIGGSRKIAQVDTNTKVYGTVSCDDIGTHDVNLTVADAQTNATQNFTITVADNSGKCADSDGDGVPNIYDTSTITPNGDNTTDINTTLQSGESVNVSIKDNTTTTVTQNSSDGSVDINSSGTNSSGNTYDTNVTIESNGATNATVSTDDTNSSTTVDPVAKDITVNSDGSVETTLSTDEVNTTITQANDGRVELNTTNTSGGSADISSQLPNTDVDVNANGTTTISGTVADTDVTTSINSEGSITSSVNTSDSNVDVNIPSDVNSTSSIDENGTITTDIISSESNTTITQNANGELNATTTNTNAVETKVDIESGNDVAIVVSSDGSTTYTSTNDDGSKSVATLNSDGTATLTQYDVNGDEVSNANYPAGADISVDENGTVNIEEPNISITNNSDNTTDINTTLPNGEGVNVDVQDTNANITQNSDGSADINSSGTNGSGDTYNTAVTVESNGDTNATVNTNTNGSEVTTSGTSQDVTIKTDGTVQTVMQTDELNTTITQANDGTVELNATNTSGGSADISSELANTDVDVDANGTTIISGTVTNSNGDDANVSVVLDSNGSVVSSVDTSDSNVDVNISNKLNSTTSIDANRTITTEITNAESNTTISQNANGEVNATTTNKDAETTKVNIGSPNDVEVVVDSDGSVTYATTQADGSKSVVTVNADGTSTVVMYDTNGNIVSSNTYPAGSKVTVGTPIVVEYTKGDTTVKTTTNLDGTQEVTTTDNSTNPSTVTTVSLTSQASVETDANGIVTITDVNGQTIVIDEKGDATLTDANNNSSNYSAGVNIVSKENGEITVDGTVVPTNGGGGGTPTSTPQPVPNPDPEEPTEPDVEEPAEEPTEPETPVNPTPDVEDPLDIGAIDELDTGITQEKIQPIDEQNDGVNNTTGVSIEIEGNTIESLFIAPSNYTVTTDVTNDKIKFTATIATVDGEDIKVTKELYNNATSLVELSEIDQSGNITSSGKIISLVPDTDLQTDQNGHTNAKSIQNSLETAASITPDGIAVHRVRKDDKETSATSNIKGSNIYILEDGSVVTSSNKATQDAELNAMVSADTDGKAVHILTIKNSNGDEVSTRAESDIAGATTTIDEDGQVQTEVTTSAISKVKVVANTDGSAMHEVTLQKENDELITTQATSNIKGAQTKISEDGNIETIATMHTDEYAMKAIVVTDTNGESSSKFVKVYNDKTQEEIQATLQNQGRFEAGHTVTIDEEDGKLKLKVETDVTRAIKF